MVRYTAPLVLVGLALTIGCEGPPYGRVAASEADVKMVGVGVFPDEIGPSPEPKGGVVEYDHVDFGGAGLSLSLMGLGGTDPVGPGLMSFAPPYQAIFGFSYIFDNKLSAADTMAQVGGAPPEVAGTCYTSIEPSGPIGSFTTVDVGDYLSFTTADGAGIRFARNPADYPPDAQDTFIYYIGVEEYKPFELVHKVPSADGSVDPRDMEEVAYRRRNFPFGEEVEFHFPGGFARQDQIVSSIPRPSRSAGSNTMTLPDPLGPVTLAWQGTRYDADGVELSDGDQKRCFEFYEGRPDEDVSLDACAELYPTPTSSSTYDKFTGQMYTGPWDTQDGKVTFDWVPGGQGDQVVLTVRWMAPINKDEAQYKYWGVELEDGSFRNAQVCEQGVGNGAEPVYDSAAYENRSGELVSSLRGDPQSQMVQVTCLLEDTGSFDLTMDHLKHAMEYVDVSPTGADGVVFFFSRGTQVDANAVPAAKDQFGQKHEITPIQLTSRSMRIGRFWWDQ